MQAVQPGLHLCEEGREFLLNRGKGALVIADQIHLVDRDDDVPHAKQGSDAGMPARLDQYAFARVHQHDGERRGGGPGRHVARVLLVPGRIRDDEFAARCREVAVGDVDGDALLALRAQAVGEQREIEHAGRGRSLAFDRANLVVVYRLRVVQQPADEGRFAVVDRACGGEAQQVLGGSRRW